MGADGPKPGALCRGRHHAADRTWTHRAMRSERSHENRPVKRAGRSTTTQIAGQRAADVDRQRQAIVAVSLAVDQELAGTPIDVIEHETRNLAAAQAEPSHQDHDREIAPPDRRAPVTARQ